jgi:hypothetical protein
VKRVLSKTVMNTKMTNPLKRKMKTMTMMMKKEVTAKRAMRQVKKMKRRKMTIRCKRSLLI